MHVIDPPVQTCPHDPQFAGSVRVFTQPVGQSVCEPLQAHTPVLHGRPMQLTPQLPQFVELEERSAHDEPQSVVPVGQLQMPAEHVRPPVQVLPHAPQF
jgi:hypothetical protein